MKIHLQLTFEDIVRILGALSLEAANCKVLSSDPLGICSKHARQLDATFTVISEQVQGQCKQ